jgi:hypothetical protein
MKKIKLLPLFAFCIIFTTAVKAQYIVTKVAGKVLNESGNSVRPGSVLKDNDRLSWSSPQDKIWAVMVGKGEKILSPSPKAEANKNMLMEVLLSSLHQNSKSGSLSGRGEIIEKIPDALRTAENSNGKLVMEYENKFLYDVSQFPQSDGSVFFLQIDIPGQPAIIRTLKTKNDTLLVDYGDLATESTHPSIKYSIAYHRKSPVNQSVLIAAFSPYFDFTSELDGTISNTILAYQGTNITKDALRDSVYRNVYANLGKPNGILFTSQFNKYWLSKGLVNINDTPAASGLVFDKAKFDEIPHISTSIEVTRGELPDNFSLRQYAPPIGDQQQTASCTAWSTSYACRTISFAIQHGYSISNHYEKIKNFTFAPDFIYNHIRNSADCTSGTAIYYALNFMKTQGDILKEGAFVCGKTYSPSDLTNALAFKIKDFHAVNGGSITKEKLIADMKQALVDKHPLPFGMSIPSDFASVGASGIWYPSVQNRASADAMRRSQNPAVPLYGHAMCIIGYNDKINNGSFEVMNSWGSYRGANGYWWVSYDDFYQFVVDVYSIEDFDNPIPDDITPKPIPEEPVVVKPVVTPDPVVVIPKNTPPLPKPIVRTKPMLKGSMEFMLLTANGSFESVPIVKKQVGTRGQLVEGDTPDSTTYPNFVLAKDFHSGNHYKIKFGLAKSAYVYVIGIDKQSYYVLFPQKKLNESAFINVNNSTLFLPNSKSNYTLDNITGKEKMCILISKSPIDLNALDIQYNNSNKNLYQAVRQNFGKQLVEMKMTDFDSEKISFDTSVNERNVLAFFVEINHLQ